MLAVTETRNEIVNSGQHTPFLLPEWVRYIKDEDKEKGTCITH